MTADSFDMAAVTGQSKPRLALAFIVRNEGRYAIQMLESILPMVGFVACVDCESTDDTVPTIKKYLAANDVRSDIIIRDFSGFQDLRNAAIRLVPSQYEWILMLDADEVIVERDYPRLLALMDDSSHDAWMIPRFNWVDKLWGRKSGDYPDMQGRLFRNRIERPILYQNKLHETITGFDSMGVVEADGAASEIGSKVLHLHHMKLFQKSQAELTARQEQYNAIQSVAPPPSARPELVQTLWNGTDPFAGATHDPAREDYQGWRSEHVYLAEAIAELRPALVVEVGVWKGGSSMYMANLMRDHRVPGVILSIDTWLGASDHWLQPNWFESLRIENGYPTLYQTFRANVLGRGLQDYILPLPIDSANAAAIIAARGLRPNVIHIDAGHDYRSVTTDLMTWWPLLAEGGVLIGDDYEPGGIAWQEVVKAFHDFFKTDGLENVSGKCRIRKT